MKIADIPYIQHKQQKREFINLETNATIKFKSFGDKDAIRGGTYDNIIVDEAHTIPEEVFVEELMPMLITTGGMLIVL